jgi:putative DNA primase/helicase
VPVGDLGVRQPGGQPRETKSPIDDALALAKAGVPVFPCRSDKAPLTRHGFKDATIDEATIREYWARHPEALIGVPMGPASDLFAVDVDVDKETGETTGEGTLEGLGINVEAHPFQASTPSGGGHLFYQYRPDLPGNSVKGLEGVDIRSDGGYVIAWEPDALIAAHGAVDLGGPPQALLDALAADKAKPAGGVAGPGFRDDAGDRTSAWAQKALAEEIATLSTTPKGGRNAAVNRCAFALGQIVGGGHLDREHVKAAIWAAAMANGVAGEEFDQTRRSITSGLDAGMAQPRGPKHAPSTGTRLGAQRGGGHGEQRGSGEKWHAPDMTLLEQERRPAPPFPLDEVFQTALASWIADEARARSAPVDYVALGLLAVAGACIGNSRWVSVHVKWQEPPVIWVGIVGNPSDNKSPALDAVIDPLSEIERRLSADFETVHGAWKQREEVASIAKTFVRRHNF